MILKRMPHLGALVGVILVAFGASTSPALAKARIAKCLLKVEGRVYLDKPCRFDAEPDGSFSIGTAATDADKREPFFAYVNVNGDGTADATWNEDASSTHAQSPLGTVKRHGACWANSRAEICAR